MSTRGKIPWMFSLLIVCLFIAAALPALLGENDTEYIYPPYAEAGMLKNSASQTVCAHLNSRTGADQTSGTVNVYYHNNSSFVSEGTATHASDGVWCYSLSANATNYSLVKILWKSTGAITLLQTYPTTGYDDTGSTVPADVLKVNGTTQTAGDIMGHLNSTVYGLPVIHSNTSAITTPPTVEQIDAELTEQHGSGPWN